MFSSATVGQQQHGTAQGRHAAIVINNDFLDRPKSPPTSRHFRARTCRNQHGGDVSRLRVARTGRRGITTVARRYVSCAPKPPLAPPPVSCPLPRRCGTRSKKKKPEEAARRSTNRPVPLTIPAVQCFDVRYPQRTATAYRLPPADERAHTRCPRSTATPTTPVPSRCRRSNAPRSWTQPSSRDTGTAVTSTTSTGAPAAAYSNQRLGTTGPASTTSPVANRSRPRSPSLVPFPSAPPTSTGIYDITFLSASGISAVMHIDAINNRRAVHRRNSENRM